MLDKIKSIFSLKKESPITDHSFIENEIESLLMGDWAIGHDDGEILIREIDRFEQLGQINILEFGAGASSLLILRQILNKFPTATFNIVEENSQWIDRIKPLTDVLLSDNNKSSNIKLEFIRCDYDKGNGFNFEQLEKVLEEQYDFVFIDSPPDTAVKDGRFLLSKKIIRLLNKNGVLILHDLNRNAELFAFEMLKNSFFRTEIISTKKGIGIMSFPKIPRETIQ